MVISRDQNAVRSHNIMTDNFSSKRVEEIKSMGTTYTNKILFGKKLRAY
jgi:hypothetical protein